ncbi:MAG TPA: hypothetical protein VKV77_04255 [Methylovirgula sp.]|nr:hypothetical protein [Methylovirgula sp.]
MPLPEGWGASPVPNINLVGKWSFQANSEGIPEDGILVFQASGVYNEFLRFPQTPQLGNQVVQVWGNYTVQGATLTERPTGGQVSNGPNPNEICNLQTNQCVALNLTPQTEQLQVVDANTIKTSTATAKRIQ